MIRKLAGVVGVLCCCAVAAGCGGSAPSAARSPGGTASPAPSSAGSASPAPSSGGSASPAWASALGPGITIIPPGPAAAGHSSPAAVVQGLVDADVSGQLSSACPYTETSFQAQCYQDVAGATASQAGSFTNFAIGYTVIDGTEALVGSTGTQCVPDLAPACETNTDPAAIFDTGQSFQTIWSEATAYDPNVTAETYSLFPCIDINGQWYLDTQSLP